MFECQQLDLAKYHAGPVTNFRSVVMGDGYSGPLYLLPFDHRRSYIRDMFRIAPPLRADDTAAVIDSKRAIYDGFRRALEDGALAGSGGVLVAEEFGYGILRDAAKCGYITALAIGKSGSAEFDFEHEREFASHIEAFEPTFVKARVHYDPADEAGIGARQLAKLRRLSDYCQAARQRLILELLVSVTAQQWDRARRDDHATDLPLRPRLTLQAMKILQDGGVEPDVWAVEGFDDPQTCERVVAAARRDGRADIACIVSGRRTVVDQIERRLTTAASVRGFVGFAVGPATYSDAVADYLCRRTTRDEAAGRIALRYRRWAAIFERAHRSAANAA